MTSPAHPSSPGRPPLQPGEKIVWQSKGGGTAGYGTWVYVVGTLVALQLSGMACAGPMLFFAASSRDDLSQMEEYGSDEAPPTSGLASVLAVAPSLVCPLLSIVLAGAAAYAWLRPRLRPSYFLTPQRILAARTWSGFDAWPLERVREARQYIARYPGRYGQEQQVLTNQVELVLDSGAVVRFGPVAELQAILDLFEHAVATRWIELASLPEIDGELAPGEARPDVLFVARTSTAAMRYGPLFIGPRQVLRFTEVPEAHQLARLYTLLARPGTAEEAEELMTATAKTGHFGHYVEASREASRPSVDATTLSLRLGERLEPVVVSARDAERARAFLRASPGAFR